MKKPRIVLDTDETEKEKLRLIEQAASDLLFLADLREVMNDFKHVDAEWWEQKAQRINEMCFHLKQESKPPSGFNLCCKLH